MTRAGSITWANTEIKDSVGYCSPVVAEFGGFRQIISMSSKAVFGVDAKTGKLLWRVEHALCEAAGRDATPHEPPAP